MSKDEAMAVAQGLANESGNTAYILRRVDHDDVWIATLTIPAVSNFIDQIAVMPVPSGDLL